MLSPDTTIHERYRIGRQLGRGGMGAVYLALDLKFATWVAVKETLAAKDDHEALAAFEREATVLNRLRHPALAHVIDHFNEAERQYLVMQFVDGENLGSVLQQRIDSGQGPFPPELVLNWAEDLLDALDYIHRQEPSVLHLDIKPHNLILEANKRLMLVDFGLARVKRHDDDGYNSMAAYTPPYASIEQLNNLGIDPRTDLFSLGVTLYHLIAGRLPPDTWRRISISGLESHSDPLVPLHVLVPSVSVAVSDWITRAMALQKHQRFNSAADMRQHLMMARQATYLHRPERDAPDTAPLSLPPPPPPPSPPIVFEPRREAEVAGFEPTRPNAALRAAAGAERAIELANSYLVRADQERDPDVSAKYLRLAQLASESARNLMDTATSATKTNR